MHSMYLAGVPTPWSMLRQAIHFAPGAIPIWFRAIVADRGASGVAAMEEVIARLRANRYRRDAAAGVNGVMPVVIVIGRYPIPAAVVRLKRVMRPANTGIGARHDNILSGKSQRPDVRRMRVSDSRLDRRRSLRLRSCLSRGPGCGSEF